MSVWSVSTEGEASDSVWSVCTVCSSRIARVPRGLPCGVACGVVCGGTSTIAWGSFTSTIRDARDGAVASERRGPIVSCASERRVPTVDCARSSSIRRAFWIETGLLSCFFNRLRSLRTRRNASRSTRVFRTGFGSSSLS